jgi:acetyl-CoA acetyltransferase
MTERCYVVGVGMTKFEKPGSREWDYPDMAREAGQKALKDAGIDYAQVQEAYIGYCYGDSTSGQRGLYELGLSGIPAVNVNNNCSTGSTALYLSRRSIISGMSDCVLALGFERMERGSLAQKFPDRASPMERQWGAMRDRNGKSRAPAAAQFFGHAGREYIERYGTDPKALPSIAEKNHRHSANNPYSQFRDIYTLEEIEASPMVFDPLTKLQCCPTSDGGAAVILASERFVDQHNLWDRAVEVAGQALVTDFENTYDGSDLSLVGYHMTVAAAKAAYEESGYGPADAQVVELHDCFSANELITYEALGLAKTGKAGDLIMNGAVTYGGDWVVNPSGGLISKGHPLGATGLAQCSELTWQIRGQADARQVDGARVAIQHNLGLGGAAVVTVYAAHDRTSADR